MDYKDLKQDSDCMNCVGCSLLESEFFNGKQGCINFAPCKSKEEKDTHFNQQAILKLIKDLVANDYHIIYTQSDINSDIGFNAEFMYVGKGKGKYGGKKEIHTRDAIIQNEILRIFNGE